MRTAMTKKVSSAANMTDATVMACAFRRVQSALCPGTCPGRQNAPALRRVGAFDDAYGTAAAPARSTSGGSGVRDAAVAGTSAGAEAAPGASAGQDPQRLDLRQFCKRLAAATPP